MSKISLPAEGQITIKSKRLGKIQVHQKEIISFPSGLIGFADEKDFVLLYHGEEDSVFYWLQSVKNDSLAFPVTDPILFQPNYKICVSQDDLSSISLNKESDGKVLVVTTVPQKGGREIWLNLQAPLIINKSKNLAKQVVLDSTKFPLRYKVFL